MLCASSDHNAHLPCTSTTQATPTGGQPAPPQLLAAAEQMQGHYPGAVLVTVDNRALGGRQAVPFQVWGV